MREKENKKGNMGGHNKVEQLQAMMEKQDYNPFGRFCFMKRNIS